MRPASVIPLIIFFGSFITCSNATTVTEIPFQDVDAYSRAEQITPHCVTECAITPSDAFKTKYSCDIVNAYSCICANGSRSVELRSEISSHCYNKCAADLIPAATSILADYCASNEAVQTQGPTTEPPTQSPSPGSTGTTLASTTASSSTITTNPGPTNEGPNVERIVSIVAGILGPLLAIATIALTIFLYKRKKKQKAVSLSSQNTNTVIDNENAIESVQQPAAAREIIKSD